MHDYDDLDTYNGNTEHDMWVDFTYHENTGELTAEFDDDDLDDFIDNCAIFLVRYRLDAPHFRDYHYHHDNSVIKNWTT